MRQDKQKKTARLEACTTATIYAMTPTMIESLLHNLAMEESECFIFSTPMARIGGGLL